MANESRCAVINGAGGGIGKELIAQLSARGYRRFILHTRSEDELSEAELATRYENNHRFVIGYGDISDEAEVAALIRDGFDTFNRIDTLINAAGIALPGAITTSDAAAWDASWKANVMGPLNFARSTAPHLRKAGNAHVINLSSIWALQPSVAMSPYSVSKYALQGLSEAMDLEFREMGIRVTSVILDKVDTGFRRNMPGPDFPRDRLDLMLKPREVARICADLLEVDTTTHISSIRLDAWRWK